MGAEKVYEAGIFDSVGTWSYLAALAAARAVALIAGKNPPKSPVAMRTSFYSLIKNGLNFDEGLATFLAEGRKIMYASDNCGAHYNLTQAESALNKGRAFLSAAKMVCN